MTGSIWAYISSTDRHTSLAKLFYNLMLTWAFTLISTSMPVPNHA